MNLQILHDAATTAAKDATIQHLAMHGEDYYCGFAWVQVREKASTKLGRALKSIGFTKAYGGGPRVMRLWNPSGTFSQSMFLKEIGAQAYADVLKKAGIDACVRTRSD
jgi:hypothetical protein